MTSSPAWSTFVNTIQNPRGRKHVHSAKVQEATRKDTERAFGILQAMFAIVHGLARFLDKRIF